MIKDFVKLYNHQDYGQILIISEENDEDKPVITISFNSSMGRSKVSLGYFDFDKRDKAFDMIDEDILEKVVPVIESLNREHNDR